MPQPAVRLALERRDGAAALLDGEVVVAEGVPAALRLELPAPVMYQEAERASTDYAGFEGHPCPPCFVCGPRRDAASGAASSPARCRRARVASPWQPDRSLADDDGLGRPEFVWAA
jgi:hypothetical protein